MAVFKSSVFKSTVFLTDGGVGGSAQGTKKKAQGVVRYMQPPSGIAKKVTR